MAMAQKTTQIDCDVLKDIRVVGRKPNISFVVPCKNEERFIADCIRSIQRYVPDNLKAEIIVVDNASSDKTRQIADACNVDVILVHSGSIGFARNAGAAVARGAVLAFVDGDVCLTPAWQKDIDSAIGELNIEPNGRISGSWCSVRGDAGWIERVWFEPMRRGVKSHMNSGHLLISSQLFAALGGFDEELTTGEDYELCVRAVRHGVAIRNDERLEVWHLGFPRTVWSFFLREVWHGKGDVQSVGAFLRSPTAVASVAVVHGAALSIVVAAIVRSIWPIVAAAMAWLVTAFAMCIRTFGRAALSHAGEKVFLAIVYVLGRGLSVYSIADGLTSHRKV